MSINLGGILSPNYVSVPGRSIEFSFIFWAYLKSFKMSNYSLVYENVFCYLLHFINVNFTLGLLDVFPVLISYNVISNPLLKFFLTLAALGIFKGLLAVI